MNIFLNQKYRVPVFLTSCVLPFLAVVATLSGHLAIALVGLTLWLCSKHRQRVRSGRQAELEYRRRTYGF